jgi:hypothetical protein
MVALVATLGAIAAAAVAPPDSSTSAPAISATVRTCGYRRARRPALAIASVTFIISPLASSPVKPSHHEKCG